MNRTKKICIIGAGISGLPAIKSCVEEGLTPVCYEKTDRFGGLWNYRENLGKDHSTVMRSTCMNTSKEMMAYSDHPPAVDTPNFMPHSLVVDYLDSYVRQYDLRQYIRFNTTVQSVTPTVCHATSGQWLVITDMEGEQVFDAVIIATGHYSVPNIPEFEGSLSAIAEFTGRVVHSQEFKHADAVVDKNVLVVGMGNSAVDCAVECAKVAKSVHMSSRTGAWMWNRVGSGGQPIDIELLTRSNKFITHFVPSRIINNTLERRCNRRFDHGRYGVRPPHRFLQAIANVNDALPNLCLTGLVKIKGNVEKFGKDFVIFKNNEKIPCDIVVMATGYKTSFPYLSPSTLIPLDGDFLNLYKWIFPMNCIQQTLAVLGMVEPQGSLSQCSELQSRLVARVFAGHHQLPPRNDQLTHHAAAVAAVRSRYTHKTMHAVAVDSMEYSDELARDIGCMPQLGALFFNDNALWRLLVFGPNTPYTYRLQGPHSWHAARETIGTVQERVWKPLGGKEHDSSTRVAVWPTVLSFCGLAFLLSILLALMFTDISMTFLFAIFACMFLAVTNISLILAIILDFSLIDLFL